MPAMDLVEFLESLKPLGDDLTEADTRALFIDPILACLGWPANGIKREPYAGWSDSRGYVDYLLKVDGRVRYVLEAKRVGRTFNIPTSLRKQRATSFRKLMATGSPDLQEALDQCLRYTQHTGALYAAATNGIDWLCFKPHHTDRALPDAKVLIFSGVSEILGRLDEFQDVLSYAGVEEGRCEKALLGREIRAPSFAKTLRDAYPYHRRHNSIEEEDYSHILDQMLRYYILDLGTDKDFDRCYVPVKSNRHTLSFLDGLIGTQAESLHPSRSAAEFGSHLVSQTNLPKILSGRTIILHGHIGVGKSSFLRSCELSLKKSGRLEKSVWALIDLLPFRDRPFEASSVDGLLRLLCEQIQTRVQESTEALSGQYDPDQWDHLRDIYNSEVRKFQKGRFPTSNDSDPVYLEEARKYVWELRQKDPQDHLVRVLRWLTVNCHLPVILVLDNSDQLGIEFQEFLYKLSETFQKSTSAITVLILRTEALASHRIREHALASIAEQFHVERPPLPVVLGKRFELLMEYLGTLNDTQLPQHKVAQERMSVLMETLEYEAKLGSDAFRIVEGAGTGSLRDALRAVAAIFRSSPQFMDQLVKEQHAKGNARLKPERALRALLKDDRVGLEPVKLIPNVFIVEDQVEVPYTLAIRMMQQVRSKVTPAEYTAGMLLNDMAVAGVDRAVAERVLSRLRHDRFVGVPHMMAAIREADNLQVTILGEVMLDIVLGLEAYYASMVFDTVIYDREAYHDLRSTWNSDGNFFPKLHAMAKRFARTISEADRAFLHTLNLSLLEPVIAAKIAGVDAHNPGA